jgi:HPt (histidine-containing phosphotransfer) domain-containing protein
MLGGKSRLELGSVAVPRWSRISATHSLEATFCDLPVAPAVVDSAPTARGEPPEGAPAQPPQPEPSAGPKVVKVDPMFESIVPEFLENRREEVSRLEAALSREDYGELAALAHVLKGVGGSLGFDDITRLGREVEKACKSRDGVRVGECVRDLKVYLDEVQVDFG